MIPPNRLYFALLGLWREATQHIGVVVLSAVLIFFIASVMLFAHALQESMLHALKAQPDFVVQKVQGERIVPIKKPIANEIIEIAGTTRVSLRVWGRYHFAQSTKSLLIVGIDFLDEQSHDALEALVKQTDLNHFMRDRRQIIVGASVAKWMAQTQRGKVLRLYTPKGKAIDLKRYATLPKSLNLFGNDMVIMHLKTAQKLFGLKRTEVTDITFDAPNELEWDIIPIKVSSLESDLRVISKKESYKAYQEMFDYKGGFFLLSFMMVGVSFMMLLFQRYTQIHHTQRKTIGILKAIGWGVGDVMAMKFYESAVVVVVAFGIGFVGAWAFVFWGGAPMIRDIFLGDANFSLHDIALYREIDWFTIGTIFILFALPYFMAVLIPVWRIATISPKEAMQ